MFRVIQFTIRTFFKNLLPSKKAKYLLLSCLVLATVATGCFEATNKFYLDSDITTDKRLEGKFVASDTNQSSSSSLVIKVGQNNHYVATLQDGNDWIKLDTVLFKVGTNLFVDISGIADSGFPSHLNKNLDDPTSALELLRRVKTEKNHIAVRLKFIDTQLDFQFALGAPFVRAINKDPTLKLKEVDDHFAILLDSSDKLRAFLSKIGNDASVFQQEMKLVRSAN